jgi:hydroxypyruvate isomerase
MDARTYYGRLKSLGFTGVELLDPRHWDAARRAGLSIVNLAAPGMENGPNKERNRITVTAQMREALATARANDIPQVIVFSGSRQGQDDEDGLRQCIAVYRELAKDAEKLGVTLAFEMLNSFDHADYMADHAAFGFRLVEAVGSPRFKLVYDIYHMHRMGERVLDDILGHLPAIAHIHVAGSPHRDFPGTRQEIDYGTIVSRVHAAGYDGFWGQEFLPASDPFIELEAVSMLFTRYARD